MSLRSAAEEAEFERVFYPGTLVLKNELGLRDAATLDAAERAFTDIRIAEGLPAECQEPTYAAFKAIHYHLFQDLYSWAGEERRYTSGRSAAAPFATPANIEGWMEKQFEIFRATDELRGLDASDFAKAAAELITEINAAHPFIEGNGRVQRIWLASIAEPVGYEFSIRPEDRDAWYEASRIGFEHSDTTPMTQLIYARIGQVGADESEGGAKRATQFMALTREQGLASKDASFRAAWLNIEKIEAIARSAMPYDQAAQAQIIAKAREQLIDQIQSGATVREMTQEQAWRNSLGHGDPQSGGADSDDDSRTGAQTRPSPQ